MPGRGKERGHRRGEGEEEEIGIEGWSRDDAEKGKEEGRKEERVLRIVKFFFLKKNRECIKQSGRCK